MNSKGFTLIEIMIIVAIIAILAAVAIPQFQNYLVQAQTTRIVNELAALKSSVDICLIKSKNVVGTESDECDPRAAASNLIQGGSQVGVTLPNNTGVAQISNPITPNVTITATISQSISPILGNKKIQWKRNSEGNWNCVSTIEQKYLPAGCTFTNAL